MQPYDIAIKTEEPENFNLWQAPELQVLLDQDTCQNCKEKKTMGLGLSGSPSAFHVRILLTPSMEVNAYCPQLPLNSQEKTALQVKGHLTKFLSDAGATHSTFISLFISYLPSLESRKFNIGGFW